MKTLVVPMDETGVSGRALPVVGALARLSYAEVLLVMVDSPGVDPFEGEWYLDEQLKKLPEISGRRLLHLVDQPVDEAIVDVATREPDAWILMATHARTSAGALLLGSVAGGVMRRSPVPVVLVGPRCSSAERLDGPVVAAVDGSAHDGPVLDVACAWARSAGASLLVVHCRIPVGADGAVVLSDDIDLADRVTDRARAAGVDAAARTVDASSAEESIVNVANEVGAGTVVVGTRRPGRLDRALLGTTADHVARHAHCPVTVAGLLPTAS